MIKVVKEGKLDAKCKGKYPLPHTCPKCDCLYSFYEEVLRVGYDGEEQYLYCPFCNERNIIKHWWRYDKHGKIQDSSDLWKERRRQGYNSKLVRR